MEIKFYAPEWGNTLPFELFCENVKAAGYNGVEMALPLEEKEKQKMIDLLEANELELIGQYWQSFESDLDLHAKSYELYLRNLISARPVFINCQTGKDYFTFEQNRVLFEIAGRLSKEFNIPIVHETHRGKSLYAAHVTQMYLTLIPELQLTLDISHWCTVHESLLHDQTEAVDLAISRTVHIHSRVGHPEGPQVNDPRAPEWREVMEAHLSWWDRAVSNSKENGKVLTITTEFGPAAYMPVMPYTQIPLANQWDINVFMMKMLKKRYLQES
ncbi:sugar phosphate isomerase/epimerase [Dyadobacter sp. CY345]|uniref:sugar phosphate isomerase/epimerase family protein n=1 Tax=Dyadobacter sp. CY345 TaxID=2909335 RepID=UPI001F39869A|nr:sugar phosphate isomerase/epimerase [Dyadobacter sp. CY345]MCF2446746.1 sugar phosphate isomerase/epimerase [Dyadobacter sp. CY345]